MSMTTSITGVNPGKAGIEYVRKFNNKMEGKMKEETVLQRMQRENLRDICKVDEERQVGIWKGDELKQMLKDTPLAHKDDIEATYVGPRCPHCEVRTQYHDGVETCPVHGKVLIDE